MGLRTLLTQIRRTAETIPVTGCLPPWLAFTRGNHFHVDPVDGSDQGNNGSLYKPFKTLARALAACVAGQNDIVFLHGRGNTSSFCTDYQSATLDWNKDLVHLIGVNAGGIISPRSRVAFLSSYATASNLFTLSANGCYIANITFFEGVTSALPTGCVKVTGSRNNFSRCHIAGIGADTNDIATAYSLKIDAGSENLFEDCVIGLDTIARGTAANSGLLIDSEAARNLFRRCKFLAFLEHASNHVHVRTADATSIDRWLEFDDCDFVYQSANYAAAGTGVMNISALTEGYVIVRNCTARSDASGTTIKWDVNDADKIIVYGPPTPAADTCNIGRLV